MPNEPLGPSYIVIPPTIDASVCNMEKIVNKVISHSPELVNKYPANTRVIESLIATRCPTYSEIKRSSALSVTLYNKDEDNYDKIIYVNDEPVKVKDEKTVKFNGKIGQMPELYVNGMLPDTEPVIKGMVYESNNLVLTLDVNAIYKPKTITIKLHGFKPYLIEETTIISSGATRWSSNLISVFNAFTENEPFDAPSSPYDVIFNTIKGTEGWFRFEKPNMTKPRIRDFGTNDSTSHKDYLMYDLTGFTMTPNGCCLTTDGSLKPAEVEPNYNTVNFEFNKTYYIKNISSDITIDIYAKKNNTVVVFVSTDDTINLYDMVENKQVEFLTSPNNYKIYNTKESNPNTILFMPTADTEIYESFNYVLTECNPLTGEETVVQQTENHPNSPSFRIYYDELINTPIVDETTGSKMYYYYTLHISSNKKYIPPVIKLITSENATNMIVAITDATAPEYNPEDPDAYNNYFDSYITNPIIPEKNGKNYIYKYEKKKNQTNYYILIKFLDWTIIKDKDIIYRAIITDNKEKEDFKFWNDEYAINPDDILIRNEETHEAYAIWKWTDDDRDNFSWYFRFERIKFILMTIERNNEKIEVIDNISRKILFARTRENIINYQTNSTRPHDIDFEISIDDRPFPVYTNGYLTADWYYKGNRVSRYSKIVGGSDTLRFTINNIQPTSNPDYSDYSLKINAIKEYKSKNITIKIPKNDSISGVPYINNNIAYVHKVDGIIDINTPWYNVTTGYDPNYHIFSYYINKELLPTSDGETPANYIYTKFSVNFSQINYDYESLSYTIDSSIGNENKQSGPDEIEYNKYTWITECDFFIHPEATNVVIEFIPTITPTYNYCVIGQPGLTIRTDYSGMEPVVLCPVMNSSNEPDYGSPEHPLEYSTPSRYNTDIKLKVTRDNEDYTGFDYIYMHYLTDSHDSSAPIHVGEMFFNVTNEVKWPDSTYTLPVNWNTDYIDTTFYINNVKYVGNKVYIYFTDTFTESGYKTTVTDNYFYDDLIAESNTAGTFELYETVKGHSKGISWNFTLPDGETGDESKYIGYTFELFYSDIANAEPSSSSWVQIKNPGESEDESKIPQTSLDWTIGTYLDGTPYAPTGKIYLIKVTAVRRPTINNYNLRVVAVTPSKQQNATISPDKEIFIYNDVSLHINPVKNYYTHVYIQSYSEKYEQYGSENRLIERIPVAVTSMLKNINVAGTDTPTVSDISKFMTVICLANTYTRVSDKIITPATLKIIDRDTSAVLSTEPVSHYISIKTAPQRDSSSINNDSDFFQRYKTIDSSAYVYTGYPFANFLRLKADISENPIELDVSAYVSHVRDITRHGTGNTLSVKNASTNFNFVLVNRDVVEDTANPGRSKLAHINDITLKDITIQQGHGWKLIDNNPIQYVANEPNAQNTYKIYCERTDANVIPSSSTLISIEKYLRRYDLTILLEKPNNTYSGHFVQELQFSLFEPNMYWHNLNGYLIDIYICINRTITGYNNHEPIYADDGDNTLTAGIVFINAKNTTKYIGFSATKTATIHIQMNYQDFVQNGASYNVYHQTYPSKIRLNGTVVTSIQQVVELQQDNSPVSSDSNHVYIVR